MTTLDFGQLFVGEASDVAKPRSRCKFAPLIEFGEFKDTGFTRQKTSNNWNGWHDLLADNPVECLEGEALTAFKLEAGLNKYRYECSKIGGLGTCFDYYSAQVDVPSFGQEKTHWSKPMRMLTVTCGHNSVLGGFHFEFSEGGRWGRVRYQCCKAGGAPVTFDPRGQLSQLVSPFDGTYCPTARDASGRPQYGSSNEQTLTFDRDAWKWCIGSHCSADTDVASPLGLVTKTWEVVNVSDFNGEFEGQMPKEGTKGMSLQDALKMKPPKRPKAPPMQELQEFKAEQPKYAAECLNYQNLWKKVTETFKDEEDNQVEKTEKLLAEPTTEGAELDDYHPCEVAKGAGGIFGPWGGGDGSTAPENMMYADWNDCMQGDIERDLASARLDYHGALTEFIMDMVEAGGGMICDAIPDVMIAPFGTGVGMNPGKICEGAMELVGAIKTFAGPASGFHFAKQGWEIEQEGYAACNPMQIGFARAFCDIHCVRDAVIRGDRSIVRNLELATKKTNNNMAALMKWSVEAAHTESGWLADKMDYSHVINVAYLQDIHNMLTGLTGPQGEGQLIERAAIATSKMFEEMQGYAEAASFNDLSRVTARDALETFLATPDLAGAPSNATALALLGHLERLHGTLRLAARKQKEQLVERQLQQSVRQLQRQAQLQLRSLGVYRLESDASSHRTRKERHHFMSTAASLERRQVMMSMDHIWWQLRKKLDEYLSVAEEEVRSFQVSLEEMGSYMHCKKGFSSLVASYTSSMASLKRSHRQLRHAWRVGSELLGEMASVIVDAEAFQSFVAEQGCESSLVKQTLKQLESAIFGMAFLLHRFRAAKLPEPDRYPLKEATKRIQEAYAAATSNCTS